MRTLILPAALTVLMALGGCSPTWNWRELELAGAQLQASFPCKPQQRQEVGRGLAVCDAQGLSFSLGWQVLDTPEQLRQAMREGPALLARRLGLTLADARPELALPEGALAWPEAGAWRLHGPGREAVVLSWVRGRTVYQAVLLGNRREPEAELGFFGALRPTAQP